MHNASIAVPLLLAVIFCSLGIALARRWSIHEWTKQLSKRKRAVLTQSLARGGVRPIIVGFFHPYCNAGGGGERVLWAAVRATLEEYENAFCVIYSGDLEVSQEAITLRAKDAFGIIFDTARIAIVPLTKRHLVSSERWPRFTLIGQSIGSLMLAYEAICILAPDIIIDTMGYAFTYPLISLLLGIPIGCYTHYPTISTDMLSRVSSGNLPKLLYWKTFALLYSFAGCYADVIMANSTWTMNHLQLLWCPPPGKMRLVYPPCNATELAQLPVVTKRDKHIVCVAQFRKEKDHETLLKAFAFLVHDLNPALRAQARLVLIGTVRNEDDKRRVAALRTLASELRIDELIDFMLDLPWPDVVKILSRAWIGTNAMWNEHFGIGVVEYLAAGLIAVVHDSAGPKLDIVTEYEGGATGFHATTVRSFAVAFNSAFTLSDVDCEEMRKRAQKSSARFSEEVFTNGWKRTMLDLMRLARQRKINL